MRIEESLNLWRTWRLLHEQHHINPIFCLFNDLIIWISRVMFVSFGPIWEFCEQQQHVLTLGVHGFYIQSILLMWPHHLCGCGQICSWICRSQYTLLDCSHLVPMVFDRARTPLLKDGTAFLMAYKLGQIFFNNFKKIVPGDHKLSCIA